MKYLFIVSLLVTNLTLSQTLCDHNVSTNPTNPTNDALPYGTPSYQARFKNHFDWLLREIDPSGTPLGLIDLPFVNGSYAGLISGNMSSIMINALDEYDYITKGPLPLTKNGWELLLLNLGTFPDNVTPLLNTNPALPYIVLYNRYSGTMRVYVNYGLDNGVLNKADAMSIRLRFSSTLYSGILRLYEGNDQALDQKTDINRVSTVCKNPTLGKQWASCDFKIAYDPCTCFYKSELKLDFFQTHVSTIKMNGRSITMPNQSLVDANLTYNPSEFLSGWDGTKSTGEAEGGFALEKNIKTLIGNYKDQYNKYNNDLIAANEHNKKVKENLSILKLATFVAGAIVVGPEVAASLVPAAAAETPEMAMMAMELAATEKTGMTAAQITAAYGNLGLIPETELDFFKVVENAQKGIIKMNEAGAKIIDQKVLFGCVKQIFGEKGKLFIANNFEAKELPTAPSYPTATFSEMTYSGVILNNLEIGGPTFYAPGSYGSESFPAVNIDNTFMYPIYNDVLGTFALLKSPKVKISKSVPALTTNIVRQSPYINDPESVGSLFNFNRYQSWTKEYQIELSEDLKYAINSILDVKKQEISASFNIIATPKIINQPHVDPSQYYCFNDFNADINTSSNNSNLNANFPIYSSNKPFEYYLGNITENTFENNWSPEPGNISPIKIKENVEFQTPYLPINAFKKSVTGIGLKNEAIIVHSSYLTTNDAYYLPHNIDTKGNWLFTTYIDNPQQANPLTDGYEYDFKIELKLIVDIEYNTLNSDGFTNKVTQVYSYLVNPNDITFQSIPLVTDLKNSPKNIGQFKENLFLKNIDFHGQEVDGCKLIGDTYICKAWNNVTIENNLTTSLGYQVEIKAGNEIYEINTSSVSPEIILSIEPVLDYSSPMPQTDQTFVTAFCNTTSGEYKSNLPSKKVTDAIQVEEAIKNQRIQNIDDLSWDFNLFPNPTTKETNLNFSGNFNSNLEIHLLDITGKEVFNTNITDDSRTSIDVSSLNKGLYFVGVISNGITKTKQLIIQ